MSYEKSPTEHEILSADEQTLREMCCSLKKIDAPRDFDRKLKARIANAKADDFRPRFGFAFRYALPALALFFVFGLLAYNGGVWSSNNNEIVAENSFAPRNTAIVNANFAAPENEKPSSDGLATSNQNLSKPSEKPQLADNILPTPKKDLIEHKKENSGGGSKVFSARQGTIEQPNFIAPKSSQRISPNDEMTNPITIKEILTMNGINAEIENGKWTVKSLTTNGIGAISGIEKNDIIEEIDKQPVSADTVFNKTATGSTITVSRSGTKRVLKLKR